MYRGNWNPNTVKQHYQKKKKKMKIQEMGSLLQNVQTKLDATPPSCPLIHGTDRLLPSLCSVPEFISLLISVLNFEFYPWSLNF